MLFNAADMGIAVYDADMECDLAIGPIAMWSDGKPLQKELQPWQMSK